jgi:acetylornithine deacetylase
MRTARPAPAVQPQRLKELLRRLVNIYSPSGKEEEIVSFLQEWLEGHGLLPVVQPVDDNRCNLVVIPPETDVRLVLVGHVDTVMAYDLDHLGCEDRGDFIIGLGTADMKGGCAAMIEAYVALLESGTSRPPVARALVVGEEEEGDGAKRLVKDYHFPWAIIGEPTSLKPCFSDYGYIEVQIVTRGKRMHASLANLGQNPIDAMLRLLLKISHYIEERRPEMVYNIRDLSSSRSGFAVPERCDAWLDIHLPPTAPLGEITLEIEEIMERERSENQGFSGSLRFTTIHTGYELPEKGSMFKALKSTFEKHSLPWEPQAFPSHSDANLLWAAGVKPILLGPGQLELAHAPDEAVSFQEVLLASRIYLDLLVSLSE